MPYLETCHSASQAAFDPFDTRDHGTVTTTVLDWGPWPVALIHTVCSSTSVGGVGHGLVAKGLKVDSGPSVKLALYSLARLCISGFCPGKN